METYWEKIWIAIPTIRPVREPITKLGINKPHGIFKIEEVHKILNYFSAHIIQCDYHLNAKSDDKHGTVVKNSKSHLPH